MTAIQTYIIFDLETTGIPAKGAKITELSFVAVARRDLEEEHGKDTLPPLNKLSFFFNPCKDIQQSAVKLNGLTKDYLQFQPPFKDAIDCLNYFLDKPKPVCLVAHNGNRFDFKILRAEYLEAKRDLPQDLLCVDSLNVFKEILKSNTKVTPKNNLADEIDKVTVDFSQLLSGPKMRISEGNEESKDKLRRKSDAEKVSYKLGDLYERLLNKKPTNAHHAEADCIMLLECVIATKKEFLPCADIKYKPISQIPI